MTTTSAFSGEFLENDKTRKEFFSLIHGRGWELVSDGLCKLSLVAAAKEKVTSPIIIC
jgi:hypothetical protein